MILCSDVSLAASSLYTTNRQFEDHHTEVGTGMEREDLRPQLLLLALRVAPWRAAAGGKGGFEDGLRFRGTLPEQRVALEVVLFGSGCGAQLTDVVL
jgi:hypothetical protein